MKKIISITRCFLSPFMSLIDREKLCVNREKSAPKIHHFSSLVFHRLRLLDFFVSERSNRPLTPMLLKSIAIHLPFPSRYFCKSMPSSWQKVGYTPPIGITIHRLPFVSRYFGKSIRARGRWNTPTHGKHRPGSTWTPSPINVGICHEPGNPHQSRPLTFARSRKTSSSSLHFKFAIHCIQSLRVFVKKLGWL